MKMHVALKFNSDNLNLHKITCYRVKIEATKRTKRTKKQKQNPTKLRNLKNLPILKNLKIMNIQEKLNQQRFPITMKCRVKEVIKSKKLSMLRSPNSAKY